MKIYLDLDGTLVDIKKRTWLIHKQVVTKLGGKPFGNLHIHWDFKRQNIPRLEILKKSQLSKSQEPEYLKQYIELIEQPEVLKYDRLRKNVILSLKKLSANHLLILVTSRRNRLNTLNQLKDFGIHTFFNQILVAGTPIDTSGGQLKARLIKQEMKVSNQKSGLIVGDSAEEIEAGKIHNIKTVAILGGIKNQKFLKSLNPDYFIPNIKHLEKIIKKLSS